MRDKLQRFVFGTRGLYLLLALAVSIAVKYQSHQTTPALLFFAGLVIALAAEGFRICCAGYLRGTQAVTRVGADFLCMSGPYAHTRNPLYLANLILGLGVCVAIDEWYGYLLLSLSWGLVYLMVIPYEEKFLRLRFGSVFEEYVAHTGRMIPRLQPYRAGMPVVPDFRIGILGEIYAPVVLLGLFVLLYVLFVT